MSKMEWYVPHVNLLIFTAPQSTSDFMEITVIVVFIIAAMIAATTLLIISIVIWQRKYTRKSNTSPAGML